MCPKIVRGVCRAHERDEGAVGPLIAHHADEPESDRNRPYARPGCYITHAHHTCHTVGEDSPCRLTTKTRPAPVDGTTFHDMPQQ